MDRYGPITDIESGRISANGVRFEVIFHANPNRTRYGVFREGTDRKRKSGPVSGVFYRGGLYLPGRGLWGGPGTLQIRPTLFRA